MRTVLHVAHVLRQRAIPELFGPAALETVGEGTYIVTPAARDWAPFRLVSVSRAELAQRGGVPALGAAPDVLLIDVRDLGTVHGAPISALAHAARDVWSLATSAHRPSSAAPMASVIICGSEGRGHERNLDDVVPEATVLPAPSAGYLMLTLRRLLGGVRKGRIALCLAGGGIEGLLYELGVLRALDLHLRGVGVVDFDVFLGISAGALLGAFLANGVNPEEISRGFRGGPSRIEPIKRSDLFDLNTGELNDRVKRLMRELRTTWHTPMQLSSAVEAAIPSALFAGARLRNYLANQLARPGIHDEFARLRRPLLVGATDQDTSRPVIFSADTSNDVAVHRAVRASLALVPFYAPERIHGRYYIDGGFTSTSNLQAAIDHGATLVIVIDPLVPVAVNHPGFMHERGGWYSSVQALKALMNSRFERSAPFITKAHPEVACHVFRPEGSEMDMLAGLPMRFFYRREVEELAFRNTLQKIRRSYDVLADDFGRHGVSLRYPELVERARSRAATTATAQGSLAPQRPSAPQRTRRATSNSVSAAPDHAARRSQDVA